MVWYADGTIQVAIHGATATGTGTAFLKNVRIGDGLTIAGSASMHEVTNIASDTQLTFSPPYPGAAGAGKQYRIAPIQGYVKEAADRLREVLRQVGPFMASEALQALAEAETDQERRAAVSLGKVDNTADAEKPASALQRQVFVEKVEGKGLSQNDLTNDRAQKLDSVQAGSQKNPDLATIAEAQAGAEAGLRSWSPVRVHNAINGWYGATIKATVDGLKQGSRMDVAGLNERNSGLLLQTGAGGWMGDVPVGLNNIDDKTVRGWRYVVEATTGTKPPGVSYGHVLTFGNTGDAVNQEFWEISGAAGVTLRKFMRTTFGTGAWGPWVSLSIESGNNSNGYYSRFPDGTQICVTSQKTRPAGGTVLSFEWAASFLAGTNVTSYPQIVPSNTWELPTGWYANINNGMMYFASGAASMNGCTMVGIGRWK